MTTLVHLSSRPVRCCWVSEISKTPLKIQLGPEISAIMYIDR